MKKNVKTMDAYEAPKIEVIEVEVEQGFAASTDLQEYGNGGVYTD